MEARIQRNALKALEAYGAGEIAVQAADGAERTRVAEGGGLAEGFERLGREPLKAVLADPAVRRVRLRDGDLVIEASRRSTGAHLRVAWGDETIVDESLELARAASEGALFRPEPGAVVTDLRAALHDPSVPLFAVRGPEGVRVASAGRHGPGVGALPLLGTVAPVDPASLGSAAFRGAHGVKWSYIAGAMAGGIASADLVLAMARAGLLAFFGAGGVPLEGVEKALVRIAGEAKGAWGFNLLHNPTEPEVEEHTVDLYLRHGVPRASASAYMTLTPAVVRYRLTGIHAGPDGRIVCPQRLFAKVSRAEVAEPFLRPAPEAILASLRQHGVLTEDQVALARQVPVAEDITAEADSGGHTDRRPLVVLLPVLQRLRDKVAREEGYAERGIRPRVGAAGGIGTPAAAWAAFALGADYVLTGSVNQASREAGTSALAKEMLAAAAFTDVDTGPAPDMFEIGANVQVLARGTMYAKRAQRLYDLYRDYPSIDAIPAAERTKVEKQLFRAPLAEIWEGTRQYWEQRDPAQVERASRDPRHQMALAFRWYLGMTSRWARTGTEDRRRDYQIWCSPAMGAFNAWAKGTALEPLKARSVVAIASALMHGAAAHARVAAARAAGIPLPDDADAVGLVPL